MVKKNTLSGLLIFLILFFTLIFLSGCGTTNDDCQKLSTTYKKYSLDEETGKCVYKTLKKNVCGNGVIEEGETYCNCPKDVSKTNPKFGCEGKIGDYLEKKCDEKTKTCDFYQNKKVVTEEKVLDFKNSDIDVQGSFKLPRPFIINSADNNLIKVNLVLFNIFNSNYKKIENINFKSISIINPSNILLGKFDFNKKLNNIGDSLPEASIKLNDISKYSSKENLKLKLVVSYDKRIFDSKGNFIRVENKIETLSQNLGYWEIINPNLYEETKKKR